MFLAKHFEVVSEVSGGMGGYDLVLAGELPGKSGSVPVFVNFNSDRGGWSLSIRFGSAKKWGTPMDWRTYLDGVPAESEGMAESEDIEWDARFIRDRLGDMLEAAERDADIETTIYEIGANYMREHYRRIRERYLRENPK
jgi:hypothetical protein